MEKKNQSLMKPFGKIQLNTMVPSIISQLPPNIGHNTYLRRKLVGHIILDGLPNIENIIHFTQNGFTFYKWDYLTQKHLATAICVH
ncbi:unnamed protein product [[Candida] boidinii]|nr:unnamed protein product [[Candida] boidinii]